MLYKLNHHGIINQLRNCIWNILAKIKDPNAMYETIEKNITEIYENNRIKTIKKHNSQLKKQEWMNDNWLKQINKKNQLWTKICKTKEPSEDLLNNYRSLKTKTRSAIQTAKETYYMNFFEKNKTDSRKMWEKINQMVSKKKKKIISMIKSKKCSLSQWKKPATTLPRALKNKLKY